MGIGEVPTGGPRDWQSRKKAKVERISAGAKFAEGKVLEGGRIVEALEGIIRPGDLVALEGDNQKQADFLSRSLARVDVEKVNGLHMLISSVSRPEHLDLFERGIARKLDFAFDGQRYLSQDTFSWALTESEYGADVPVELELTLPIQLFSSIRFKITVLSSDDSESSAYSYKPNGVTLYYTPRAEGPRLEARKTG